MIILTRLKKRNDFVRLSSQGIRSVVSSMVVLVGKNSQTNTEIARVGFTASRKIGNAVKRNRAKRRLRVLANEIIKVIAVPGYDYVLIAREKTLSGTFDALKQDLKKALYVIHAKLKSRSSA